MHTYHAYIYILEQNHKKRTFCLVGFQGLQRLGLHKLVLHNA